MSLPGDELSFRIDQRALERDGAKLVRDLKDLVRSSRNVAAIEKRLKVKMAGSSNVDRALLTVRQVLDRLIAGVRAHRLARARGRDAGIARRKARGRR